MNSITSRHPAPAFAKAIACFKSLRAIGVSAPVARAVARLHAPDAPRGNVLPVRRSQVFGVIVCITIRDGAARGLTLGN